MSANNEKQLEENMVEIPERERRLRILESPQKLDSRFGWSEFAVLSVVGLVVPAVLVVLGWTAGA
ncbi:hypothetical protein [Arthrobacter sp.]|uniref:hypothetical protein n=1 Tax=Arthrobacter sp. TaxID=1667 RepID=UPI002899EDC7|nr:hypothetical protein [Arthrobacter sp.]